MGGWDWGGLQGWGGDRRGCVWGVSGCWGGCSVLGGVQGQGSLIPHGGGHLSFPGEGGLCPTVGWGLGVFAPRGGAGCLCWASLLGSRGWGCQGSPADVTSAAWRWTRTRAPHTSGRRRTGCTCAWRCWPPSWAATEPINRVTLPRPGVIVPRRHRAAPPGGPWRGCGGAAGGCWRGLPGLHRRSPPVRAAAGAGPGPPLQLGTLCAPAPGAQPLTAVTWGPIVTPRGKQGRSPTSGGGGWGGFPVPRGSVFRGEELLPFSQAQRGAGPPERPTGWRAWAHSRLRRSVSAGLCWSRRGNGRL